MKRHNVIVPFLLLILSFFIMSCDMEGDEYIDLSSGWKYSLENPNREEVQLKILPDSKLLHLETLLPAKSGTVYLTKTFLIPYRLQKEDISCYLGHISFSDRTYLNHYLIGSTGITEGLPYSAGTEARFYEIPEELLLSEINTITIEINVNKYGYFVSDAFISFHDKAKSAWIQDRFWNTQIYLILASILVFLSFYSVSTFFKLNSRKDSLFFCLLCVVTVLNLSIIYALDLPFAEFVRTHYSLFFKLNIYLLPSIIIYLLTLFVDAFFKKALTARICIIRFLIVSLPQILWICISDFISNETAGIIPFIFFIPGLLYIVVSLFSNLYRSTPKSFKLTMSLFLTILFPLLDLFCHAGMNWDFIPYFSPAGWTFSLFTMMFIISSSKIEELKNESKTELSVVVPQASPVYAKPVAAIAEKQIFSVRPVIDLENYEIAYCYKPSRSISEDMYDFFTEGNCLDGLVLFETSRQNESASEITNLAKRVVVKKFQEGKKQPLTKVMEEINSRILEEKGSADNFLTGILLRTVDTRIEYVNVGHSPAFFRNLKTNKCVPIQINSENFEEQSQAGIGAEETSNEYRGIAFNLNPDDSIIIYSKAFEEAKNTSGESFSQERICQAFYQSPKTSAKDQLQYILDMFQNYTRDIAIQEDVTVIVVRKK